MRLFYLIILCLGVLFPAFISAIAFHIAWYYRHLRSKLYTGIIIGIFFLTMSIISLIEIIKL
jgi:hypothetical protein